MEPKTIICYHAKCPDGFGGAYAAWKKFGNTATYVPLTHDQAFTTEVSNARVYFIDFCFKKEVMDAIVASAASVTVLDHHEGMTDVVHTMPEYVYDNNRSGAVIAWNYFHPDTPTPLLLQYVQEGDLYRFALPHSHAVLSYVYTHLFDFAVWDSLREELESETGMEHVIERGTTYSEHAQFVGDQIVENAEPVRFEGYDVYLGSCARMQVSYVGNTLAKKYPPLALVATVRAKDIRISLRGDGSVDVAKIAQKYGGNGHTNAAAFTIPLGTLPPLDSTRNQ